MTRRALNRLLVSSVDLFNRNPWTNERLIWVPKIRERWYATDGLWTYSAHPFLDDPDFQRAYARAVKAAGWDYEIAWRVHVALWAATVAETRDGAYIECGTARGFMASAICEYLNWGDRPFLLHDTFQSTWTQGGVSSFYAESAEKTAANFAEWPGVSTIVGPVPDTLSYAGPVAFVHIDMNNAEAEIAAARYFWPHLRDGGVMLFDDYGFPGYSNLQKSLDGLADELGFAVLAMPTGQGVVIK